ncbi:hypothetical protein [[Muricauda] lutisoli]|uniref:Uncharacterized protein n=1 Tax=[Muricauda] lutisoli TaxID=2816035 RepID=A0ABS3EU79_9FLAO|nr:hypothetical protein [[Muricauda] lutisoli]MBO0329739.1 hypothetical protein [[Muricauda] lutisoli]
MSIKYIKIFEDELVAIEKVDGTVYNCVIDSTKNDLNSLENLSSDLQDFYGITVTLEGKESLDVEIRIKDIHSIERLNQL